MAAQKSEGTALASVQVARLSETTIIARITQAFDLLIEVCQVCSDVITQIRCADQCVPALRPVVEKASVDGDAGGVVSLPKRGEQ